MPMGRNKFRTNFNRGVIPTIACVNKSKIGLGVDFDKLILALQKFLDDCFVPVWGTPAKLVKARKPRPGCWTMIFLDNSDLPGARGYHDITWRGMPLAKVFVKPAIKSDAAVSVTACHELCEMLVDPMATLWCEGPRGTLWAYEVCDAVEEETFDIAGIAMSDFVFPAYFNTFRLKKPRSAQYDYLNKVKRPFQLLKGGYSAIRHNRRTTAKFGSRSKARRFAEEDRRWHRSQFRKRQLAKW
jgi:hypothetical protein